MRTACAVLALLSSSALRLSAQSCTTGAMVSPNAISSCITTSTTTATLLTTPRLATLSVTQGTASFTVTSAMMNAGTSDALPVTLTVNANRAWSLSVSGGTWTATGAYAWNAKPLGDLTWSASPSGARTAVTSGAVQLGSSATGNMAATSITIYFFVALSWNKDSPGSYTVPVTYTLTAP